MKGLLIAYTFYPDKRVGALRPTYWAEEIAKNSAIQLTVITATETDFQNAIYIPNDSSSWLSYFIKDSGVTWRKNICNYFKDKDLSEYDFVIFTGGPFLHFTLTKFFKKKGLKIILDYRDPFYNPIFEDKGIRKMIKLHFEAKALKFADLVISVNKECHELITYSPEKFTRVVIPNGFDERQLPTEIQHTANATNLFVAGKFYWDPSLFLTVLQENQWTLTQAGIQSEISHPYFDTDFYNYLGTLSQSDLYHRIFEAEIGVVFTLNVTFQSTTKIYDYIGLNKKILIVTQGEPNTGALLRELQDYPYYRWVKNDKDDIKKAIEELQTMEIQPFDAYKYSRKYGLDLLIEEIKKLV